MTLLRPSRRGFLIAAASLLAAPAIVRVASIMPVKGVPILNDAALDDLIDHLLRTVKPSVVCYTDMGSDVIKARSAVTWLHPYKPSQDIGSTMGTDWTSWKKYGGERMRDGMARACRQSIVIKAEPLIRDGYRPA